MLVRKLCHPVVRTPSAGNDRGKGLRRRRALRREELAAGRAVDFASVRDGERHRWNRRLRDAPEAPGASDAGGACVVLRCALCAGQRGGALGVCSWLRSLAAV